MTSVSRNVTAQVPTTQLDTSEAAARAPVASAPKSSGCPFHRLLGPKPAPRLPESLSLDRTQMVELAQRKATCPFIGAAVATGVLPVRNSAHIPLAGIDDVKAAGNSGGGSLGIVLGVFANGNHAKLPDGRDVPPGTFSLDFPGSQGAHPGHSGILMGAFDRQDTGHFSQVDFDRLVAHSRDGYLTRKQVAAFIAENLHADAASKVASPRTFGLLAKDLAVTVARFFGFVGAKVASLVGYDAAPAQRQLLVAATKTAGENNLVGSAGEFALLFAFLEHAPNTKKVDGQPALAVKDLELMFKDKTLPEGWETWPKHAGTWVKDTTLLSARTVREYVR